MRVSGPLGRLVLYVVCGVGTLGVLWPAAAAAQTRAAAIRVHAAVRGVGDADLLGASAVTTPETPPAGAARAGERRRTRAGRGAAVGIRVDGGAGVSICETAAGAAETCEPYRAPRATTGAERTRPDLVVRVRQAEAGEAVRLTVAFIDF